MRRRLSDGHRCGPGCRLPSVRLRHRHRARPERLGRQHLRRRRRRGRGRSTDAVAAFERRLVEQPPPLADHRGGHALEAIAPRRHRFHHRAVHPRAAGRTLASPDVATCADCLRELADPADRRYRHPFITCTNCGPRFTIITALPYDRPATTMAGFPMCAAAPREYADPADRRFHAQPIACHDCGPTLELVDPAPRDATRREDALAAARALLADGGGRSRSRGSAATTSPATPPTSRRWPSCAGASGAATSRSR